MRPGRVAMMCALTIGCGRATELSPTADAGDAGDAGPESAVDSGLDAVAPSGIPRCGPGPWLIHSEQMFYGWGTRGPVVGQPARIDACPDLELRSDEEGYLKVAFTFGQPYDLLVGLPGLPPFWYGRYSGIVQRYFSAYFVEPPKKSAPYDPSVVALSITPYLDAGRPPPCDTRIGLRASIVEYPSAKTHYWIGDLETDNPDDPRVSEIKIDGLPPDVDVTVLPSKPGCATAAYFFPEVLKKTRTHRGITQVDVIVLGPEGVDAGADASVDASDAMSDSSGDAGSESGSEP